MPRINSTAEYMAIMAKASQNAMEFCLEKCAEDLEKYIQREVYAAYDPVTDFRTGDLLKAWKTSANVQYGHIMFSEGGMHQSLIGGEALGFRLLDVLEAGYRGLNAKTGKQIPPRKFWEHWLKHADKMAGKWYAQGLRQQGIKVIGR